MPILNIVPVQIGAVGVVPNIACIATNDTLATVLTTGYLNQAQQNGASLAESTMCLVSTKTSPSAAATQVGWLEVSHVGANWSLVQTGAPGTVTLPTIANHIATYTNTAGQLSEDPATAISGGNIQAGLSGTAGYLASFPSASLKGSFRVSATANTGDTLVTLTNAAHGQASTYAIPDCGASAANLIVSKTTGTQHITVGSLQVDAGTVTTGLVGGGTAGGFAAYSATAANGALKLTPVAAGGAFDTTISNGTMGQSTVYTIPDVGAATGQFLVKTAALVDGQLIKASGTAGKVAGAGFSVLANTTAAYAGGGTSNAFVATGLGATSIVTAVILTSTNAVSIVKAVPSANTLTVDFSADPGAATTVSWIAITPAV